MWYFFLHCALVYHCYYHNSIQKTYIGWGGVRLCCLSIRCSPQLINSLTTMQISFLLLQPIFLCMSCWYLNLYLCSTYWPEPLIYQSQLHWLSCDRRKAIWISIYPLSGYWSTSFHLDFSLIPCGPLCASHPLGSAHFLVTLIRDPLLPVNLLWRFHPLDIEDIGT